MYMCEMYEILSSHRCQSISLFILLLQHLVVFGNLSPNEIWSASDCHLRSGARRADSRSGHARYMSRCLHCKGEVATVKQVRHSNVFKCPILIVSYTKLLIIVIDKALNCLSV